MTVINRFTLNECKNRVTSTYIANVVPVTIAQWEDVHSYFSTHSILNVKLHDKNGNVPVPSSVNSIFYQDRDFIINEISKGSVFAITNQLNITPQLFNLFEDLSDFFIDKEIDIRICGNISSDTSIVVTDTADITAKIVLQMDGISHINLQEDIDLTHLPTDHTTKYNVKLEPGSMLFMHGNTKYSITGTEGKQLYLVINIK